MIVVKIELWPMGSEAHKKEIGRMLISNDGTSQDPKRGSYNVRVMRRGTTDKVQRLGRVENHPRKSHPIWELVRRSIVNAFAKLPSDLDL